MAIAEEQAELGAAVLREPDVERIEAQGVSCYLCFDANVVGLALPTSFLPLPPEHKYIIVCKSDEGWLRNREKVRPVKNTVDAQQARARACQERKR